MDIMKEISWAFYTVKVKGIRHVDTEALNTLIDDYAAKTDETMQKLQGASDKLVNLDSQLTSCKVSMNSGTACTKQVNDLLTKNANQATIISSLNQSLKDAQAGKPTYPLPQDAIDKLNAYYVKYPEASITSDAHYIGVDKVPVSYPVQDWCLIGSECIELKQHVQKNDGYVMNIATSETNGDFFKATDIARARIKVATPFKYAWDSVKYGVDDFWQFAHETFKTAKPPDKGEGDCDDGASEEEVLCEIAGIPRVMRRIACGNTRGSREGHATNYQIASDWGWRHINSTTNYDDSHKSLLQFPRENDSSDSMGLNPVWYSYNGDKSFHGLPTTAAQDMFNKSREHRLRRKVTIIPLGRGERHG